MHFTLWANRHSNEGAHTETTWPDFLSFVAAPAIVDDIDAIEGWSPVKFTANRRAKANVELVSAIVLDDDKTGLPMGELAARWGFAAGVIHTSRRHTPGAPRYRIVLRCSRDMTPDEHAIVWRAVRDLATSRGQVLDESTKDPSRLWFCPAHLPGAPYEWCELPGAPLDVDRILAMVPAAPAPVTSPNADIPRMSPSPDTRRAAMAAALGAAWPERGRHQAQLALAGALRAEGFAEAEAVEFLCAVCRAAGNEDRAKREATCRHTYGLPADAPMTSWQRLASFVDRIVVDAARGALRRDAGLRASIERRLAEVAAETEVTPAVAPATGVVEVDGVRFLVGGLDAEQPPIPYQIGTHVARGEVDMLVAHGNSLKTWVAFSLAVAVATGRPWLGQYPATRGRVAIIDEESGAYEVTRRLKLLGVRDDEVEDRLMRNSFSTLDLGQVDAWVTIAKLRLDLLVLDSFAALTRGTDENDARAAELLHLAARYAEATNCTVIVIHHSRKGAGDGREKVRGSTAIFAACDRVYEFSEPEKHDDGRVVTSMHTVKDGAGRRPPEVRVELSDKGLRWLEPEPAEAKAEEKAEARYTEAEIRAEAIAELRRHPTGLHKTALEKLLHGSATRRRRVVEQLLTGPVPVAVTFTDAEGRVIMLRPGFEP